ncbi:uncharacterized protein LOC129809933 [Phlebotomus papatasi]|nr:uncharacterized protein LOC129809933 [Phlebotomus papatasi]
MNLSIGIDRRILYKLSISQMDVDEYAVEVSWDCEDLLNSNDTRCENFEGSSSHRLEVFFTASGMYRITAIITYQELTQELSSYVTVDPRIIASVQFPNIKPEPLVSWRSLRVPVIVNNVIPLCHLQWSTVNVTEDPRYGFIDRSYFPSRVIPDLEKNFLSDIVEISNATYSEDFPLVVPAGSEDFAGIEPEKSYVFRLLVTCPAPIQEWDSESEGNVTSYTDLILGSKQAPIARPLQVFPEEGTALKTLFTMFTGTATDTPDDYPLRYLFQYQIGGILVDLEEYYENMEIITELPYSEEPIRIFYRVCDTRNACSRTEGPPIRVNLTEDYSDKEFQFKLEKIKSMIFRTDYTNMFSTSISCIFTFKAFGNKKFYDRLKVELLQEIQRETSRLETFKSEDMFISEQKILSFVKYSKILAELLGDRSIKLKEKLLNLLNTIPQSRSDEYGSSDESNLVMKRSIDEESFEERNLSEDDFLQKGILELQLREAIINSQNNSENSEENLQLKQNFTQQVRDFIGNLLCPSMQLSTEYKLVSSDFSLEIYRGNGFQAQVRNFSLPASPSGDKLSSGFVFLRNVFDTQPTEEYCASRIAYSSDFLTGDLSQEIISVDLFEIDSELNSARILEPGRDSEKFSVISFQLSNERYPEEVKCVIWNGETWTDEYCLVLSVDPSSIECQCSTLGFVKPFSDYRYEYSEDFLNVTITTELINTTPTISSTNELIMQSESTVNDPPVDYILKSNVIQTESLVITTDIKQTAKSVSDMFTFSPIVNKGAEEVVSVTTTIQKNSSEPTDDHEEIVRESSYSSLIGFIVIGVFCLIIILMLSLNLYFMRKKRKMKHLQELQIMSTEARMQSEEIKYARFYDEQMLSGN